METDAPKTKSILKNANQSISNIPNPSLTSQFPISTSFSLPSHNEKSNLRAIQSFRNFPSNKTNESLTIHEAAAQGQTKILQTLLEKGNNPNLLNDDGLSPLHEASLQGHEECVKILLQKGANPNILDPEGSTPLHLACMGGHTKCAEILIVNGANLGIKDKNGNTSLHRASYKNQIDIVKILILHHVPIEQDKRGFTPIHQATLRNHHELLKLLLSYPQAIKHLEVKDFHEGNTALHLAAFSNSIGCLNILFEAGVNLKSLDKEGNSALHKASLGGHPQAMLTIIEHEPSLVNLPNHHFQVALHFAVMRGYKDCIEVLLKAGAKSDLNDEKGNLPSFYATSTEISKMLTTLPKMIKPGEAQSKSEPSSPISAQNTSTFHRFKQLSISTSALDDSVNSGETIIKTVKKVTRVESNYNIVRCQRIMRQLLKRKSISQWHELFLVLKSSSRSKINYRIIRYEIKFYSELVYFLQKFKVPLGFLITPIEVDGLFADLESLKNHLKTCLSMFKQYSVPKVFSENSLQHMKVYSSLVGNIESHLRIYFIWKNKPEFVTFEQNFATKCPIQKNLVDILMAPIYRLKTLRQQFLDLKESTASNYIDYDAIVVTCNSIQTIWDQLNTNRDPLINFEETRRVKTAIPNLQHPLVSTWRQLIKEGELMVRTPSTKKNKLYDKYYVFLFTDLLLFCKSLPLNQYSCQEILRVETISVVDEIAPDKALLELKLWQSTDKPIEKYLINAPSVSVRKDWEESLQNARKFVANTDFFAKEDEEGLF